MRFGKYLSCIETCLTCAAFCNNFSASVLQEKDIKKMATCIQLNLECAALCYAAAQLMSLGSTRATALCGICAEACEAFADECVLHENVLCKACVVACRACAKECKALELPVDMYN